MRWFIAVVFAVLIGTMLPDGARAQCSAGLITNCPPATNLQPDDVLLGWQSGQNPHTRKFPVGNIVINSSVPWIQASAYGVKADGATSNDQALGLALYACSQAHTKLLLPPGQILLTGAALSGNATRSLNNCSVEGSGAPAGGIATPVAGTQINVTSTSVSPFVCKGSWSMSGVNFFYPGQTTGTTAYPPTITDGGVLGCQGFSMDHIVAANPWDFFKATSSAANGVISNFVGWPLHDLFQLPNTYDSLAFSNIRVTPGPWLDMTGQSITTKTAIDTAVSAGNSFLHVTCCFAVTVVVSSMETFDLKAGVLVDSGGIFANSIMDVAWDGMYSIVKVAAGGLWSGNDFKGSGTECGLFSYVSGLNSGTPTCFDLQGAGQLDLNNFQLTSSRGSFAVTTGMNIVMRGGSITGVGTANDGVNHYGIHSTASTGGTTVLVDDVQMFGNSSTTNSQKAHTYGVVSDVAIPRQTVQNSAFLNFQTPINLAPGTTTIVTGNWSGATNGSASFVANGTAAVQYGLNMFDIPPTPTVSACGSGPSPTVTSVGFPNGVINTGGGTVNSCVFTMPFVMLGNSCVFQPSINITIGTDPLGLPPAWTLGFSATFPNGQIFYRC